MSGGGNNNQKQQFHNLPTVGVHAQGPPQYKVVTINRPHPAWTFTWAGLDAFEVVIIIMYVTDMVTLTNDGFDMAMRTLGIAIPVFSIISKFLIHVTTPKVK